MRLLKNLDLLTKTRAIIPSVFRPSSVHDVQELGINGVHITIRKLAG